MATTAHPEDDMRPNIPSALVRLPAVKSYEQVDREIIGTLRPSFGWFVALVSVSRQSARESPTSVDD